jgi:oxygen-independent coproporphyrinogen-3 oxidase
MIHSPGTLGAETAEPLAGNYFVSAYPPFSRWQPSQVGAVEEALERPTTGAPIGLYVHIPFCPKKCDFCYFLSFTDQPAEAVARYLDSVVHELSLYARRPAVQGRPVAFVYVGGGTPSALSPLQVRRLVHGLRGALSWERAREFTFECAPRSVRRELLETLREVGVTRISMGVQSFDDGLLRWNGRVHLVEDVLRAWVLIRKAGFECVNLDLMVGLIGETDEIWRESVRRVIELDPDRVTIYQTEIPHNTLLYRDLRAGRLPAPSVPWETKRARLDYAFRELERAGYTVVSGYAAAKTPERNSFFYCEHLWRGGDMLGLGIASFSYLAGMHFQNVESLPDYEAALQRRALPLHRAFPLTKRDQMVREFILQMKWGIVAAAPFRARYGVEIAEAFAEPLRELASDGLVTVSDSAVKLTRKGLLRVDRLLPRFYDAAYRGVRYT